MWCEKTHNYSRHFGFFCNHMQLLEGHSEGYHSYLCAACLCVSAESWYIHLVSVSMPLLTVHAQHFINPSSCVSCCAPWGLNIIHCFSHQYANFPCLSQGHTTSVMHNTFMTRGAFMRLHTNIPLHHAYLDYVSFSKNKIHASQRGCITSWSIMLFVLSCFDT